MNQLAQIADIIEEVLNTNHVENANTIAETCAAKLVKASLEQLTTLLGSELEVNELGETVLNLGSLA
jgi:hypothetical protein